MAKQATFKDYIVTIEDKGRVVVSKGGKTCDNTAGVLKEIAKLISFTVEAKWNTQQLGAKIYNEISKGGATAAKPVTKSVAAPAAKASKPESKPESKSAKPAKEAKASSAEETLKAEVEKLKAELAKAKAGAAKTEAKEEKNSPKFKDPFEGQMVKVCAGMFSNGNKRYIISKEFQIGKYQVTQGQWKAIMGEGFNPSYFRGDDNLPVETVSWDEVQTFIEKLNKLTGKKYRLPTAAEWRWAAMGASKDGDQGDYAGCKFKKDLEYYAWCEKNSKDRTHPVGQKRPNELGLYDMSGNVYEMCSDYYGTGYLGGLPGDNVDYKGPATGTNHVGSGGCYLSSEPCINRTLWYVELKGSKVDGFRLCL